MRILYGLGLRFGPLSQCNFMQLPSSKDRLTTRELGVGPKIQVDPLLVAILGTAQSSVLQTGLPPLRGKECWTMAEGGRHQFPAKMARPGN